MPPLILFEYPPRANSCLESVFLPRKHTLHNQVYACIHSKILSLIHCTKVYMPISMKACVCIALCICSIHTFPIHTLPVCIDCYRVNTQTHRPYQSLQAAMSMRPSSPQRAHVVYFTHMHAACSCMRCVWQKLWHSASSMELSSSAPRDQCAHACMQQLCIEYILAIASCNAVTFFDPPFQVSD